MRSAFAKPFRHQMLAATMLTTAFVFPAAATTVYSGVAAGDMTASDAILWTRAQNGSAAVGLTAQVSTDAGFSTIVWSGSASTVAANDYTLKLNASGLDSNSHYFYHFTDGTTASQSGQFTTTPTATQNVAF